MNSENSRKIKLLRMWDILKSETDEEHPIATNDLIRRLGEEGIEVDRKILYADIELLNKYGYEVMTERRKSNYYYVEDRSFNETEVRILMDAVQASAFVTEKKTEELLNKISQLPGSKKGRILKGNVTKFSTVKGTNERIYYSVDTIIQAIKKKKKISFCYLEYNVRRVRVYKLDKEDPSKNRVYTVNPVTMVLDDGQYYLICYDDKHDGDLANYRIDRMADVVILEDDITPNKTIDIAKYKRQQFNMFGGAVKTVEFEADKTLINTLFDKFGANIKLRDIENGKLHCTVEVQESPMFTAWCCSFDSRLKVLSPPSVVEKIKKQLKKTLEQYE